MLKCMDMGQGKHKTSVQPAKYIMLWNINQSYFNLNTGNKCSGALVHDFNSFHNSGYKLNGGELHQIQLVRFNIDLKGKYHLIHMQFSLWTESHKLSSWTEIALQLSVPTNDSCGMNGIFYFSFYI